MLSLATRHDRERSVLRLWRRTAHRRIDETDSALVQRAGNPNCGRRSDGRHVAAQQAISGPLRHALRSEQHALDLRGVHHHRDDDIALRRERRRRVDRNRVVLGGKPLRLGGGPIPNAQLESGLAEVRRHPPAHDPQAYESDVLRHAKVHIDTFLLSKLA